MPSKSIAPVRFAALAFSAIALVSASHGQDPNIIQKVHLFTQTSLSGAVSHPTTPYALQAQATATGRTLHLPSGATQTIPYVAGDDSYEIIAAFSSKAALDAAYPNGTYTITASGTPTLTFNLTTDSYPTATPQVTNGTWNAGGLLVIDPTVSNVINISNFTTYASAGVAGHENFNLDTNTNNFQMEIATQAVFGLTAASSPFTSVTIPANTLTNARVFRAEIGFDTLTTLDTTTVPSGVVALFRNRTEFYVAALTPGTPAMPQPVFVAQPTDKVAALGSSVTFTANVTLGGTQNVQVNWYFNGVELSIQNGDPKYTVGFNAPNFTLTINNVAATDVGSYTFKLIDTGGMVTSNPFSLSLGAASVPTITTQPVGHNLATGSTVVFNVVATGGGLSYQWKKGGVAIGGATGSQYLISNAQPSDGGSYTVTVTNTSGSVTSTGANLSVAASADPGRLINASVRIVSGTGANVLIVGFVTGGAGTSGSKQLLIRGVGPTLTGFGVPGAMVDPVLDIIPSGGTVPILSNNDWAGDASIIAKATQVGAFALPDTASKDSALLTTLASGVYSAKVSGNNTTSGTVLAEMYDANPSTYSPTTPRIINLSARVPMANDNPLITGFVIGGSTARTLMVRAIGPTLTGYGVPGAMSDPQLELYQSSGGVNTLLLTNDNWNSSALVTSIDTVVGAFAPTDNKDAVLLVTLDPGVYSAKVLGVGGASGITLVELYEVP